MHFNMCIRIIISNVHMRHFMSNLGETNVYVLRCVFTVAMWGKNGESGKL